MDISHCFPQVLSNARPQDSNEEILCGDRCDAPAALFASTDLRESHNSIRLHPRGAILRIEGVSVPKRIPELLKGGAVGIGGIAGLMRVLEDRA